MTSKDLIIKAYLESGFIETQDLLALEKDSNLFIIEEIVDEEDEGYIFMTQDTELYFNKEGQVLTADQFWGEFDFDYVDYDDEFDEYPDEDE